MRYNTIVFKKRNQLKNSVNSNLIMYRLYRNPQRVNLGLVYSYISYYFYINNVYMASTMSHVINWALNTLLDKFSYL